MESRAPSLGDSCLQPIWGGILGAICATLGVVLPSLVIIMAIFSVIVRFENSKLVKGFLYGAKPCAMGLILSAFITVLLSAVIGILLFGVFQL